MNFEERIDRLTERHEALAQSLELIAMQTGANSKSIDRLTERVDLIAEALLSLAAQGAETRKDVQSVASGVQDLIGVMRDFDARVKRLEAA